MYSCPKVRYITPVCKQVPELYLAVTANTSQHLQVPFYKSTKNMTFSCNALVSNTSEASCGKFQRQSCNSVQLQPQSPV